MKFSEYTQAEQQAIINRVQKMLNKIRDRCYNTRFKQYKDYGGRGVYLCERWHDKLKFAEDIVELPGWDYDLFISGKLELDKDFLNHNNLVYCKEYCALLTRAENMQYRPSVHKPFYAYHQYTQEIKEHFSAKMFAEENNCSVSVARNVLQGNKHRTGDWYLWYKDCPYPDVYRVYARKDGITHWEVNPQKLSLRLGLSRTCCATALNRSGYTHRWAITEEKVNLSKLIEEYESNKTPNDYRKVTFYREDTRGNLVEYTFNVEM
jgi:hypothetical protein